MQAEHAQVDTPLVWLMCYLGTVTLQLKYHGEPRFTPTLRLDWTSWYKTYRTLKTTILMCACFVRRRLGKSPFQCHAQSARRLYMNNVVNRTLLHVTRTSNHTRSSTSMTRQESFNRWPKPQATFTDEWIWCCFARTMLQISLRNLRRSLSLII